MYLRHVVFVVGASVVLWGCGRCDGADDETMIRSVIEQGVAHAESGDVNELFSLAVKEGFVADPGDRDRREAKVLTAMSFRRFGTFRILYPRYLVKVNAGLKEAVVRLPFVIAKQGQAFPGLKELMTDPEQWAEAAARTAEPYYMHMRFVKDRGEWKVARVQLTGVGQIY